jgi:hypothetical protein
MPTAAGNAKYIESADKLWGYFISYKAWVESNPYEVVDWVGGFATQVTRKKQRPLTFLGFKKWLALENITSNLSDYEANKNGAYEAYSTIITRIKDICNGEIIEGASAGVYNANIAARVTGLVDKTEQRKIEEPRVFKLD